MNMKSTLPALMLAVLVGMASFALSVEEPASRTTPEPAESTAAAPATETGDTAAAPAAETGAAAAAPAEETGTAAAAPAEETGAAAAAPATETGAVAELDKVMSEILPVSSSTRMRQLAIAVVTTLILALVVYWLLREDRPDKPSTPQSPPTRRTNDDTNVIPVP